MQCKGYKATVHVWTWNSRNSPFLLRDSCRKAVKLVQRDSYKVCKPVYRPNLIMNSACCLTAPYAVTSTILPRPRKPHFCLMALNIIKGRKWSLEAFKDHGKISKLGNSASSAKWKSIWESKGEWCRTFPGSQVQNERQHYGGVRLLLWKETPGACKSQTSLKRDSLGLLSFLNFNVATCDF